MTPQNQTLSVFYRIGQHPLLQLPLHAGIRRQRRQKAALLLNDGDQVVLVHFHRSSCAMGLPMVR